ncbi:MAG: hypothetical protein M3R38_00100 [Actinomycetota bacterium]|nr:hypothetical protein [Actinomycetota bacterium]MDP9474106.1 hypothetical protein [Actinomycetota bacterium]
MNALLRITGIGSLISLYRYIYINQPQLTRLAGIALILTVGAIHAIEAPDHFRAAAYLGVLFALNVAATLVAALGILRGAKVWGWTLGALVSGLSALAYLASRLFGLPGLGEAAGGWDEPLGSLALIFEGLFLAGWFSIVTGLAVAAPDRRSWND